MDKKYFLLILILFLAAFLRIWKLDAVPVSLFGDEVDVGYHAYSFLRTGRDYLGNILPVNVSSLADIKPAFYSYSAVPTVALFGISPLGIRLPAAIFGILGIWFFYLLINQITKNRSLALLAAFLLAISSWHIQYSRWGEEESLMIAFFLVSIYCFFKALMNNKWLILSAVLLGLTVWTYHAAKIFIPISVLAILIIWRQDLKKIPRKILLWSGSVFLFIVFPMVLSFWFGGVNRFGSTSIFSESTIFQKLQTNYLQAFSPQFLFISGDPNPRQNPPGEGELYKYQILFLILGLIFFSSKVLDRKIKTFFTFWLLAAPLPSIVTKDGGDHASRLIFLLPILIFLISLGIYQSWRNLNGISRKIFWVLIAGLIFISFLFYQDNYWMHYPRVSEKWWHAGFKEAISSAIEEGSRYDRIIISQADEPALIFFLGYSMYPPNQFRKKYPLARQNLEGFGQTSKLDKYYFPAVGKAVSLYELGSILPPKTLYLATFKEVKWDLVREPDRLPKDIQLIKSITYPSGQPAFYLFVASGF